MTDGANRADDHLERCGRGEAVVSLKEEGKKKTTFCLAFKSENVSANSRTMENLLRGLVDQLETDVWAKCYRKLSPLTETCLVQ